MSAALATAGAERRRLAGRRPAPRARVAAPSVDLAQFSEGERSALRSAARKLMAQRRAPHLPLDTSVLGRRERAALLKWQDLAAAGKAEARP